MLRRPYLLLLFKPKNNSTCANKTKPEIRGRALRESARQRRLKSDSGGI